MTYDIKEFEIPLLKKYGFLPGVILEKKTIVIKTDAPITYTEEKIPARFFSFNVGEDYKGLPLPKGTESVMVVNLPDGTQVINYKHRIDGTISLGQGERAFKSESRTPENRVELSDFVK